MIGAHKSSNYLKKMFQILKQNIPVYLLNETMANVYLKKRKINWPQIKVNNSNILNPWEKKETEHLLFENLLF